MLIDPHIHTRGISHCSKCRYDKLVDICLQDGIDAIVLTNHYKHGYYESDENFPAWRQKYVDEYRITKEEGARRGVKVFFGLEVTLDETPYIDYVIYGLSDDLIEKERSLAVFSQKELFDYCESHNAVLYQAHPYRNGTTPQDPRYLHGVEINCHPMYNNNDKQRIITFAAEHSLKLSCGSDYHGDTYKPHCGIYVPDDISDTVALAEFLRRPEQCELEIHDIIENWRSKHKVGEILTK